MAIALLIVLPPALPSFPGSRKEATEFSSSPCPAPDPGEQARSAEALLESGNTFYASGDLQKAEKDWIEARACTPISSSRPKAVFNLGILEMQRANYPKAIEYFSELLQSHPNDREPGANLLQAYRNYSHRSAIQISICYEEMTDYRNALRYARLAKTRYPYQSWCGTCLQSANVATVKRIAHLSLRVYGIPALAVVALAGILFLWNRAQTA